MNQTACFPPQFCRFEDADDVSKFISVHSEQLFEKASLKNWDEAFNLQHIVLENLFFQV